MEERGAGARNPERRRQTSLFAFGRVGWGASRRGAGRGRTDTAAILRVFAGPHGRQAGFACPREWRHLHARRARGDALSCGAGGSSARGVPGWGGGGHQRRARDTRPQRPRGRASQEAAAAPAGSETTRKQPRAHRFTPRQLLGLDGAPAPRRPRQAGVGPKSSQPDSHWAGGPRRLPRRRGAGPRRTGAGVWRGSLCAAPAPGPCTQATRPAGRPFGGPGCIRRRSIDIKTRLRGRSAPRGRQGGAGFGGARRGRPKPGTPTANILICIWEGGLGGLEARRGAWADRHGGHSEGVCRPARTASGIRLPT